MGLGLSLLNDNIGATNQTQLFVDYSYRIHLGFYGKTKLQFGIKAGLSLFSSSLTPLENRDPNDPTVFDYKGKLLPNVGVGLFYYGEKGYLGLSVPKLLKNYVKGVNEIEVGEVKRHLFFTGGYVFDIGQITKFKPSFMVRMVSGAPISVDLSAMFYFYDKLGLGLAMRREDSFSGLINYYFDNSLFIGYAYDFTRTELRDYSHGTHEIVIGYDFPVGQRMRIYSPRFF
jgi:type IX secretion system PorP/SprF family membrane protein